MKKLSWLLCLMTILFILPVASAFAESTASYDSGASVGFYGEYVYPGESDTPSENEGGDRADSSTEGNESNHGSGKTSENGTTMLTLPQTGDIANSKTTLIGLLFISFAFLFIYKRKQRTI